MSRMQNDINIFKKNINGRPLFQQNSYMPDIMNPHKSQKKHYDVHHNSEIARLAALDSMLQPDQLQLNPEDPRNVINGYYQQFLPHGQVRQQTERSRSINRDEISNLLQPNTMRYNRSPEQDIDSLDKFKRDFEIRKNSNDASFHMDGYHMQNGKNYTQMNEPLNKNDTSITKQSDKGVGRYIQTEIYDSSLGDSSPVPMRNNKANQEIKKPNLLQEAREFRERPPSNRNNVSKSLEPKNFQPNLLSNNMLSSQHNGNSGKPSPRYDNPNEFKLRVEPVYNSNPEPSQQLQRFNSQPDLIPVPDAQPRSSPPLEKSSKLLDQGYKRSPNYNVDNKKVVTYNIIANKPIQRDLPNKTRLPYKYAWEMNRDLPPEIEEHLTKLSTLESSAFTRDKQDPSTASLERLKNYDPRKNGNVFTLALRNEINGL